MLQVFNVDEDNREVVEVTALVDVKGERPIALHGGPLLGIAFASTVSNGAQSLSLRLCFTWFLHCLQWYTLP